jgi:hypothetical protein
MPSQRPRVALPLIGDAQRFEDKSSRYQAKMA